MFWFRRKSYTVLKATDDDLVHLPDLHGRSFPRGWSEAEFESLVQSPGVTIWVAKLVGGRRKPPAGFNIVRQAGDEAEILSIGVDPSCRGRGLGRQLMDEAIRHLQGDRVGSLFLEVDENNSAAISLYRRIGFADVGVRPGYYETRDAEGQTSKQRSTALVMRIDLTPNRS